MTLSILLVEASNTMRQVIEDYLKEAGNSVDSFAGYGDAAAALKAQFESFEADYDCLVLGWPTHRDRESDRMLGLLESVDHHDLPVVVLSQDMRPDSRAWIVARGHSVMLKWNDYRSLEPLIEQITSSQLPGDIRLIEPLSNYNDIRLLVVDDSTSIRYALRDLLNLHGYQVSVAGSVEEALSRVRSQEFDLVMLDYYLQDSTGDDVCRVLINESLNQRLMCAVMIANYSEHIIKHSLNAGACECLFKNESSDLLLARVDALSRIVRQQHQLEETVSVDNAIIETIAGSVLVFDTNGIVTHASDKALSVLGHTSPETLVWRPVTEVVGDAVTKAEKNRRLTEHLLRADGSSIEVMLKARNFIDVDGSENVIVVFKTSEDIADSADNEGGSIARNLFVKTISDHLEGVSSGDDLATLLVIDVGYIDEEKLMKPVAESPASVTLLSDALTQVYRRENHVAYLGQSRFGILLRHATDSQAYLLTRKIMQIANDIGKQTQLGEFSCNGALLKLESNSSLSAEELLVRVRQGLKLVETRGRNNALLMDLKRLLPVYPNKTAKDDDLLDDE